jgi:hypothetical protein
MQSIGQGDDAGQASGNRGRAAGRHRDRCHRVLEWFRWGEAHLPSCYGTQRLTSTLGHTRPMVTSSGQIFRKECDQNFRKMVIGVSGTRNGEFAGAGCQVVSSSLASTGTQETVAGPAAAGSTARLVIVNFSTNSEPTTLAVVLQTIGRNGLRQVVARQRHCGHFPVSGVHSG